ncbi:type II toxin-antitoxin system prevent-host-death family antitoxin [bacterium]|nr:type II toxin-antitoxin system prevent-host-death family antitoxin [bacterium]
MEKIIGLTEARSKLSDIVNEVMYERDTYIISKQGKPAVAVVPLEVLARWRQDRARLFQVIEEVQAQNQDADPDELMEVILEAQQEVRKQLAAEKLQPGA